jgi:hypothetical protein
VKPGGCNCPNCGRWVPGFALCCPMCGAEAPTAYRRKLEEERLVECLLAFFLGPCRHGPTRGRRCPTGQQRIVNTKREGRVVLLELECTHTIQRGVSRGRRPKFAACPICDNAKRETDTEGAADGS